MNNKENSDFLEAFLKMLDEFFETTDYWQMQGILDENSLRETIGKIEPSKLDKEDKELLKPFGIKTVIVFQRSHEDSYWGSYYFKLPNKKYLQVSYQC